MKNANHLIQWNIWLIVKNQPSSDKYNLWKRIYREKNIKKERKKKLFTMHICDNLVICSRINRGTIWSTMDLINANSIVWIHFFSFEWVDCQMKVTTSFENNQKVMIHCLIQLIIQSILLVLPFPWINIQKKNRKFSKNRKNGIYASFIWVTGYFAYI